MDNALKKICKTVEGSVLTFGLEEKYVNFLKENANVTFLDSFDVFVKVKKTLKGREKKISISRLSKRYKNTPIDIVFYEADYLDKYGKELSKEIMSLSIKELYIIGEEHNLKPVVQFFNHYTEYDEKKEFSKKNIVHYTIQNCKRSRGKELIWNGKDKALQMIEKVQDFLAGK